MRKSDRLAGQYQFNNQEDQYYGYTAPKAIKTQRNFKYDQNFNPNIIEEDSSKEIGTISHKLNNSSRKLSKVKSERGISPRSSFYSSSNLKERIEKACPTNNTSDLKKQISLLRKEIERLEKELFKKDKQILESKTAAMPTKQNQSQLMQLYRIVNYYEGKIKEMEGQIKKFRDLILKVHSDDGIKPEELNVLFQQLTEKNQALAGEYEVLEFQKNLAQQKYKKLESKYHETHRELSQFRRREQDPLNKNNSERAHYMYELLKSQPNNLIAKQQFYNLQAFSVRIKELEEQNEECRSQNQMLKMELQDKNNQITQLHKEYVMVKKSLKSMKSIGATSRMNIGSQRAVQMI